MNFDWYIFSQLSFLSLIFLMLGFRYFLIMLIILELIIMNIVVLMFSKFIFNNMEIMFIFYLVFSVCESVLGLTILVLLIRYYGGDYYNMLNYTKF